jgi:hypothetical protein
MGHVVKIRDYASRSTSQQNSNVLAVPQISYVLT